MAGGAERAIIFPSVYKTGAVLFVFVSTLRDQIQCLCILCVYVVTTGVDLRRENMQRCRLGVALSHE